jgi:hypothetical protein
MLEHWRFVEHSGPQVTEWWAALANPVLALMKIASLLVLLMDLFTYGQD